MTMNIQIMNKQINELKRIIEAAILVSDDPISINRLISLFPEGAKPEKPEIMAAIEELSADCEQRGIELKKVGSGFRFQSKERYAEFLRKLYELKPPRYSRAVLETLSIIAYRQPVTRGDIEDVRGVSVSTEIMRTLLNRQWVKEVGFKDVPGRPALYATTKEFLAYFNLKTIREMPELQQKRELDEIAKDNQISLPLDQASTDQDSTQVTDHDSIQATQVQASDEHDQDANVVELHADDASASSNTLDYENATISNNEVALDHDELDLVEDESIEADFVEAESKQDEPGENESIENESGEDELIEDETSDRKNYKEVNA